MLVVRLEILVVASSIRPTFLWRLWQRTINDYQRLPRHFVAFRATIVVEKTLLATIENIIMVCLPAAAATAAAAGCCYATTFCGRLVATTPWR
jgi:hypothetical protein